MARLVSSKTNLLISASISTIFEDGSIADHSFKEGDILEGLRYVDNEEIVTVSGKVKKINYTLPSKASWKVASPSDTLSTDITLSSITLDASSEYESNVITVPFNEIVEWEDEKDVARMKYAPKVSFTMEMYYSDRSTAYVDVSVGDTFTNVLILNPKDLPNPYTGDYEVIAFGYTINRGVLTITSIAFKDAEGKVIVSDLEYILKLNEVFTYAVESKEEMTEVLSKLANGDTINFTSDYDATEGNRILITKDNITVAMAKNVNADSSGTSGVTVTNGSVTVTGDGLFTTSTPYDSKHGYGVFSINAGGEATFNGSGVYAVIEGDPVKQGQFGVTVYKDGKLTINDGTFTAGWFCVTGNGASTNEDSIVTINGGTLVSKGDYAVYSPGKGKLIINGGYIEGAAGAVTVMAGSVEINGGTLSSTDAATENVNQTGDGTRGLGNAALNLNARYGEVTCTITGGIFKAIGDAVLIDTGSKNPVHVSISGGKFTAKVNSEWLAEGYVCAEEPDSDGYYEVKKSA